MGLAVFSAVMTVLAASTLALARHVGRARLLRPGTPDAVLREADVAMYMAKAHGKGRFELASSSA